MKKLLLVLALAGAGKAAIAQSTVVMPFNQQNKTDILFQGPRVGTLKKRFDFNFPKGNKMILEFIEEAQVDSLPSIDSLVQWVWSDLRMLGDSLNTVLDSRRVDVVFSGNNRRIRMQRFPQKEPIYQISGSDITQLKIEQDTLRLKLFTARSAFTLGLLPGYAYYITFIVNHLHEIPELVQQESLNRTLQVFKTDFANRKKSRLGNTGFTRYFASYNIATQSRTIPVRGALRGVGKRHSFAPYLQTGIQYVRGAWVPSAGAGLQLEQRLSESAKNIYRLMWEPHFVFGQDSLKGGMLSRNDFLTLKIYSAAGFSNNSRDIRFVQNFSVGYLIRRRGRHFEASTFKCALPGLQTQNVLLEPEFFFNRFFKNFSPSLKLSVFIE